MHAFTSNLVFNFVILSQIVLRLQNLWYMTLQWCFASCNYFCSVIIELRKSNRWLDINASAIHTKSQLSSSFPSISDFWKVIFYSGGGEGGRPLRLDRQILLFPVEPYLASGHLFVSDNIPSRTTSRIKGK